MEVVLALSTIRRAISAVTNSSADDVAPDLEIRIVKAMGQRWSGGSFAMDRQDALMLSVLLVLKVATLLNGIGVYGSSNDSLRCHKWITLLNMRWLTAQPWLLMGDFNFILCNNEKLRDKSEELGMLGQSL
ncbi:hypothetical protein F0562_017543 [Nyssa sinensis]|uniref:Endonuclease/exonuclease/phosphatase domain-containing protein n=1 Tax=Nyssa sinensis TaxID=561372 RepID=A0A5J4ZF88_9ASTE|nr:hypothetical protein F0562_017543 [Nyssa sinensis]